MKNLIFDMDGVLIKYDPEYFLTSEGVLDPSDRELLITVWVRLGRGVVSAFALVSLFSIIRPWEHIEVGV